MAELLFGLGQTKHKKQQEAKIRFTKASLEDVNITETVEWNVRTHQHDRDQKYKETGRVTKKNLKDISLEETKEMRIRAQHNSREKKWKQTGRDQIEKNTEFDMARRLFGGHTGGITDNDNSDEYSETEVTYSERSLSSY